MKTAHASLRSLNVALSAFAAAVGLGEPEERQLQRSLDKVHGYPAGHELAYAGQLLNVPLLKPRPVNDTVIGSS